VTTKFDNDALKAALPDFAGFLRLIETGRPGTVSREFIETLEHAIENELLRSVIVGWLNDGIARAQQQPGLFQAGQRRTA
jgi:hypothetical protein